MGKMVEKRGQFSHQFSGTKSSIPCISGSRFISQGVPHLFLHGQWHSHVSYKQARGHSVSNTVKSSSRIMELCPKQKPDNFSHPHSREAKRPSRSQVKNFQGFHRMDAQSKHFQGSGSQVWSTRHRPICIESEPPDSGVRIVGMRAEGCGTDAFSLAWNYHLSYLFPPFSLIPLCLKKILSDQSECILIAPVWKSRPWYPILLSMLSHQP